MESAASCEKTGRPQPGPEAGSRGPARHRSPPAPRGCLACPMSLSLRPGPSPPGSSKFFFGIGVWERPPLNLPPAGLPQKASRWTPHTRPILTVTSTQRPWMLHPVGPTTQPPGHLPALLACRPPEAVSLPFKVPGAGPTCIKVF